MKTPRARRRAAGDRAEHNTDRYVAPKVRAGSPPSIGFKSQASKKGRMSPRKHR